MSFEKTTSAKDAQTLLSEKLRLQQVLADEIDVVRMLDVALPVEHVFTVSGEWQICLVGRDIQTYLEKLPAAPVSLDTWTEMSPRVVANSNAPRAFGVPLLYPVFESKNGLSNIGWLTQLPDGRVARVRLKSSQGLPVPTGYSRISTPHLDVFSLCATKAPTAKVGPAVEASEKANTLLAETFTSAKKRQFANAVLARIAQKGFIPVPENKDIDSLTDGDVMAMSLFQLPGLGDTWEVLTFEDAREVLRIGQGVYAGGKPMSVLNEKFADDAMAAAKGALQRLASSHLQTVKTGTTSLLNSSQLSGVLQEWILRETGYKLQVGVYSVNRRGDDLELPVSLEFRDPFIRAHVRTTLRIPARLSADGFDWYFPAFREYQDPALA